MKNPKQIKEASLGTNSRFLATTNDGGDFIKVTKDELKADLGVDTPAVGEYPAGTKVYRAFIQQVTTGAPTVSSEIQNTLGTTPVFARTSIGEYTITAVGAFNTTTAVNFGSGIEGSAPDVTVVTDKGNSDSDTITFLTLSAGASADSLLFRTYLEIIVYP